MKRVTFAIILFGIIMFGILGCDAKNDTKEALLCTKENEKYVFYFDDNGNSIGIYYENIFDFHNSFTDTEMQEFSVYGNKYLRKVIDQKLINCNALTFTCESSYNNDKIFNKIYVKDKEQAKSANLDEYYDINDIDLRTKIVANEDVVCKKIIEDDNYKIKGNKTEIHYFNKVYNSVEEMNDEVDKPKYYNKYDLVAIDGQKGTIEFKENGICKIDLSDFDSESYQYCEGEEENTYKLQKNVVTTTNQEIKLRFDYEYNQFEFTNGEFKKLVNAKGPLQYKNK